MHGRVRRGYLGIAGRDRVLETKIKRFYHLPNTRTVEVVVVEANSPAYRAGLKEGDLLAAVNGEKIEQVDDLHRFLAQWPIGTPVRLRVLRGVEPIELTLVPTEAP